MFLCVTVPVPDPVLLVPDPVVVVINAGEVVFNGRGVCFRRAKSSCPAMRGTRPWGYMRGSASRRTQKVILW